jgi:hypothetical protein
MSAFSDEAWRAAAENLAKAVVFLQSRQVLSESSDVSLIRAVGAAIERLDNAQTDPVATMGDEVPPAYIDTSSEVGLGELQRLEKLRAALLGDEGLIEVLKSLEPPQGQRA